MRPRPHSLAAAIEVLDPTFGRMDQGCGVEVTVVVLEEGFDGAHGGGLVTESNRLC